MLEFALRAHGQNLFRLFPGLQFTVLTGNPGGKALAERLCNALPLRYGINDEPIKKLCEVMKRVQDVGTQRDWVVHGSWNLTPAVIGHFEANRNEEAP
jgi:hypothetical protein